MVQGVVPASFSLARVHQAIQAAMGWNDAHLHEFRIGDRLYGDSGVLYGEHDFNTLDASRYRLGNLVNDGDTFAYQYDFGDSWEHEVTVFVRGLSGRRCRLPELRRGRGCVPARGLRERAGVRGSQADACWAAWR